MEANIVRPFVTRALETFYKLSSSDMIQETDNAPNRQQTANRGPRVSYMFMLYIVKTPTGAQVGISYQMIQLTLLNVKVIDAR